MREGPQDNIKASVVSAHPRKNGGEMVPVGSNKCTNFNPHGHLLMTCKAAQQLVHNGPPGLEKSVREGPQDTI